ncbi:MAG: WecB/TagA/CpsF family glycosyltransferase, partial [Myxococcota bacterium]
MNAAKWVALRRDPTLRSLVRSADTVAADGISVVWLSRWLGTPLPGRVPGIELAEGLLDRAAAAPWRVALLGARPEVVTSVASQLARRGIDVVLAHDGYTKGPETWADAIAAARPDLLLVALGSEMFTRFQFTGRIQSGIITLDHFAANLSFFHQ